MPALDADSVAAIAELDGGKAALALVANRSSARRMFNRKAINLAMGAVRAKILSEGLCGVRPGSPSCVGAWCNSKTWGGRPSKG